MITALEHDDIASVGESTRHAQSQFGGLAATADEEADFQRCRQRGGESFCVSHYGFVQVACVRIQERHLLLPGRDDPRVAVADMGHIVDRVQVVSPGRIKHP